MRNLMGHRNLRMSHDNDREGVERVIDNEKVINQTVCDGGLGSGGWIEGGQSAKA